MDYSTNGFNGSTRGRSEEQLSPTASSRSVQTTVSHAKSIPSINTHLSSFNQGQNLGEGVALNQLHPSNQTANQIANHSGSGQYQAEVHSRSPPLISLLNAPHAQNGQGQGQTSISPRSYICSSSQNICPDQIGLHQGQKPGASRHPRRYAECIFCPQEQLHRQILSRNSTRSPEQNLNEVSQEHNCHQYQPSALMNNFVTSQGHCEDRTSPRTSLRGADHNNIQAHQAQSGLPEPQNVYERPPSTRNNISSLPQGHSRAPRFDQYQSSQQGTNRGQSQGTFHVHSFYPSQVTPQGEFIGVPPPQSLLGQTFYRKGSECEGNSSIRSQGQPFQGQEFDSQQVPPQLQSPGVPAWEVNASAQSQMQSQNQFQSLRHSQSQFQPQDQNQIHSQDPVGSLHQRQTSSSRLNPAVPAFQPIYSTSFQSFQPTQGTISKSPTPQVAQLSQPAPLPLPQPQLQLHLKMSAHNSQALQVIPMPVHQMMSSFHQQKEKVKQLVRKIKSIDDMDPHKQEGLVETAEELGSMYKDFMQYTKSEYETIWRDRESSKEYLNNCARNLRQAYMERDQLGADRDAADEVNGRLMLQNAELSKRMKELETQWKTFNNEMDQKLAEKSAEIERNRVQLEQQRVQLDHQRGQIEKQASELGYNLVKDTKFVDAAYVKLMTDNGARGMHSRRHKQSFGQDPFLASPSIASSSTFPVSGIGGSESSTASNRVGLIGRGFSQSSALGHTQPDSGPPKATAEQTFPGLRNISSSRRFPMPGGRATGERIYSPVWPLAPSRPHITTEPGDTPLNPKYSTALVLSSVSADDPSSFYQEEFATLYQLMEGWAMAYCTTPKISNDQSIARSKQVLWNFMMKCTYPGKRQDAHTHLTTLLNSASTRPWFVVRMGVEYIVEDTLSVKSYKGFSPEVDTELSNVETQLQERGLHNDARQALINRRAKAIQSAVSSPQWEAYRNEQLAGHSKHLRDILGPMLDDKADRSKAGKDLGYIALKAWDISEHMNTSQLTFQVTWPETAGKFVAATMISKDDGHINPMNLQLSQARLKLIITPVITMRDDRGTTIKAKNLHFATVLTMK